LLRELKLRKNEKRKEIISNQFNIYFISTSNLPIIPAAKGADADVPV
jgi:hypothetical protein